MSINFFELKYLIVDSFYSDILINSYTYEQAWGICYESFLGYIKSNNIECVVAISTLIRLKLRHKLKLTEQDLLNIKKIFAFIKDIDVKSVLNGDELEYLEEDMAVIKEKVGITV